MLEKFLNIKGVGRFEQYAPQGDLSLKRVSVIYAENGKGKSTLTAVLRSAASGDSTILTRRRTLGFTRPIEVKLRWNGDTVEFGGTAWSQLLPEIEVFDEEFVLTHVHTGPKIDVEHRRNLHELIVGAEANRLRLAIEAKTGRIRDIHPLQRQVEEELAQHLPPGVSGQEALAVTPEADAADRLREAEGRLRLSQAGAEIAELSAPRPVTLPFVDLEGVLRLQAFTVDTALQDAEQRIQDHIIGHTNGVRREWLIEGTQTALDERCPYCAQPIAGVRLVQDYRAIFSAAFREHQDAVAAAIQAVSRQLSDNEIDRLQDQASANALCSVAARRHSDEVRALPQIDFRQRLRELREAIGQALRSVHDNNARGTSATRLDNAIQAFGQLATELVDYNEAVSRCAIKIGDLQAQVAALPLPVAQAEVRQWTIHAALLGAEARRLRESFATLDGEKTRLDQEVVQLREQVRTASSAAIAGLAPTVNATLQLFGASFQVRPFREAHRGAPSVVYALELRGHEVPLEVPQGTPGPHFATALSAGDKRTLAFAFFLARLGRLADLDQRVVVFDDPVASLDDGRRSATISELARIGQRARQLIVLSHQPTFLEELYRRAATDVRKALEVFGIGQIREWDPSTAGQLLYVQRCAKLSETVTTQHTDNPADVAGCIRPVIEFNLRVRFPGQMTENDWVGGFISGARAAEPNTWLGKFAADHLAELEDLNEYGKHYHHEGVDRPMTTEALNVAELVTMARRTLKFISGLRRDQ